MDFLIKATFKTSIPRIYSDFLTISYSLSIVELRKTNHLLRTILSNY